MSEADGDQAPARTNYRAPSWTGPDVLQELAKLVGSRGISMGRLSHPTDVASAAAYFGTSCAKSSIGAAGWRQTPAYTSNPCPEALVKSIWTTRSWKSWSPVSGRSSKPQVFSP